MKNSLYIILFSLAVLSGCSTMDEQECRSADWYQLGVKDGQEGKKVNLLDLHKDACRKYGVWPDEGRYLQGRDSGLLEYCQLGNALRMGLDGDKYQGVCPLDLDMEFRRHNSAALDVYNSREKIENIDNQIAKKEKELGQQDLAEKEKLRILEELRKMDRQRERLRSDLHYQERELDRLMDDIKQRGRWHQQPLR